MEMQNRILGNIVGEVLSQEDLELISGGREVVCNGCQVSTSTNGPNGPGCHGD